MKPSIKTFDLEELTSIVDSLNQPKFRAKQLFEWLYAKGASSFDEMSNLPKDFRLSLSNHYSINTPTVIDKQVSKDGTRKFVLSYFDDQCVEAVGMPSTSHGQDGDRSHLTVCISSQSGCAMQCKFCATGKEGFKRNLALGEIVDQVLAVEKDFGRKATNVVVMGQGEPFQNYEHMIRALKVINNPRFLGIGARHITVSTCGIIDGINRFSTETEQFTLAVSLHSAVQGTRDELMPRMKNQSLVELKKSLNDYIALTNRRVSFEYLLIDECNDDDIHLNALIDYCRGMLCHINLLPMNKVSHASLKSTSQKIVDHWVKTLMKAGIETTVRNSRGSDISGACGQLKNKRNL